MEKVKIIDDNLEALLWRLRMINSARHKIVMFTFMMHIDHSGTDVLSALAHAAQRGVEEYILVDSISSYFHCQGSDALRYLLSFPNVHFYFYNPVFPANPLRITFRMHDKILAIDDEIYMAGGRNVLDSSIGNYKEKYNIDRDVVVLPDPASCTNSIGQICAYIESMWKQKAVKRFYKRLRPGRKVPICAQLSERWEALCRQYPWILRDIEGIRSEGFLPAEEIRLISGDQSNRYKGLEIWCRLIRLMKEGDHVLVQTPYMMCNELMYTGLREVIKADSTFSIITNAPEAGANYFGCADLMNQKPRIRKKGITVYECFAGQSLHTKSILIDDSVSIIGSFNFDMRSAYMDTELMLFIRSTELNAQLKTIAEDLIRKSRVEDSSGRVTYGEAYSGNPFTIKQALFYAVLRVLVRPFRFLL